MMLDEIIASTKIRVAKAKENLSPSGLLKAWIKRNLKHRIFKNGLMSIDDVFNYCGNKKHRRQRDLYAEILTI